MPQHMPPYSLSAFDFSSLSLSLVSLARNTRDRDIDSCIFCLSLSLACLARVSLLARDALVAWASRQKCTCCISSPAREDMQETERSTRQRCLRFARDALFCKRRHARDRDIDSFISLSLAFLARVLLLARDGHWSKKTAPPGGVSYLLCSLIKNPEEEDPPRSTWYKFFEGGPLASDSWLGNIV